MMLEPTVINHFKTLLAIDNPSRHEAAMRTHVLDTLQHGDTQRRIAHVHVDDIGNLLVRIKGQDLAPPIMLCAHMDSVPPCINIGYTETTDSQGEPILQAAGETILGADDRAGIATMLAIAEAIQLHNAPPKGDLELYFSVQEEIGINGARVLDLDQVQSQHIYVLDGEGHAGDIFNAGPARQAIEIDITGKSGHAGLPEEGGISALHVAIQVINALPTSGRQSPNTSFNLGKVSGGGRLNIIHDNARIEAEARSFDLDELAALDAQINTACTNITATYPGSHITCDIRHQYDPFTIPEHAHTIQAAQEAGRAIALDTTVKRMYIGSDAHILNAREREAIVLGMGFHGSHSVREFIHLKELTRVVEWVWALIH